MSRLPCSSSSARGLFLNVLLAAAIPAPLLPTRPLRVLPSLLPKSPNLPDAKMTISFHSPCARAMLWLILKWEDASSPPHLPGGTLSQESVNSTASDPGLSHWRHSFSALALVQGTISLSPLSTLSPPSTTTTPHKKWPPPSFNQK